MKILSTLVAVITSCFFTSLQSQSVYQPCGEANFTVTGKFNNTSAATPIMDVNDFSSNMFKVGLKGEISKYFEETIFGMNTSGWINIATVEITGVNPSKDQLTFRVLEAKSVVTINGKQQSHFVAGKIIKFQQIDIKVPQLQQAYYENGDLKSAGNMECGVPVGNWKYYYAGNKVKKEGAFTSGKEDGLWKEYHESGKLKLEGGYILGVKNGVWNTYDDNGKVQKTTPYVSGGVTGLTTTYLNGKPQTEEYLVNDERDGVFKQYNETGVLIQEGNYTKDKKSGIWKEYNNSGVKLLEVTYINNKKTGPYYDYFPNGSVQLKGNYDESEKLSGEIIIYYQNGQIESVGTYKKDIRVGSFKSWYANGNLKEEGAAGSDGRLEGLYTSYYENGSLQEQGTYAFDSKSGKWSVWDEKGKKKTVKY